MGPPKDVRPSFRNAVKTSPTRPSQASPLIATHRQGASMLHCFARELPNPDLCKRKSLLAQFGGLVQFPRDAPLALHARCQIPLAFHPVKHRIKGSGAEP